MQDKKMTSIIECNSMLKIHYNDGQQSCLRSMRDRPPERLKNVISKNVDIIYDLVYHILGQKSIYVPV